MVITGGASIIHIHAAQIAEAVGCKVRYKEPFVGGQFGIKATSILRSYCCRGRRAF